MKKTISLLLLLVVASCASTTNKSRTVASAERDLSGTYLGVSKYKLGHDGPDKAATRIYFHKIEGEEGSYSVVLLEYVNLLKIAPKYIASNKLPIVANKVGYLNSITSKIVAYKATPGKKEGTLELWPLVVSGNSIVEKKEGQPRIITLSADEGSADPLAGATISSVREGEPEEIFFPKDNDEKRNGMQYGIAKLVYAKAKLESTWRTKFLTGPYLAQYAKKNDVVLDLSGSGDNMLAEFKINEANSANVSKAKREKVFTNKDSAFLKGEFNVTEPMDGMFLFSSINADAKTNDIVKGKIGLFIDVFDATKSLNQDVVELALIDSEQPGNFLMYYEHPDNGEGSNGLSR